MQEQEINTFITQVRKMRELQRSYYNLWQKSEPWHELMKETKRQEAIVDTLIQIQQIQNSAKPIEIFK
jgi:hypothetical protein